MRTEADEERRRSALRTEAAIRLQLDEEADVTPVVATAGARAAMKALEEHYAGLREFLAAADDALVALAALRAAEQAQGTTALRHELGEAWSKAGAKASQLGKRVETSGSSLNTILKVYCRLAQMAAGEEEGTTEGA
ncbi:MAG: hypothetical protein M3P85_11175 [Actinomycetota bacterium]|nr:hypothetical protein [Actinomycetota bacterium]